ncbi:MAG: PocR ligand-binding domain-containing protein [Dehalobacterium sp.]
MINIVQLGLERMDNELDIIEKIFEKKLLERLLNSFSTATKLHVAVTDTLGNVLISSKKGNSKFCSIVRSTKEGLKRCRGVYGRAGKQATKWNEPYIFRCHAGLTAWVCPIMVGNNHVGNIVCGQILMWEPQKCFCMEIEDFTRDLGHEPGILVRAVKQLEIVSPAQVQAASDMLFIMANYFAQGSTGFGYQQKLRTISSWLWRENNQQGNLEEKREENGQHYLLLLEDQIKCEIRKDNITEAEKFLNKIALQIFIQSKGQIEIIKALGIEFISFLVRLSTEKGVNFAESYKFSMLKFDELNESDTVEKVILWLLTVGRYYLDLLCRRDQKDSVVIINKTITYIQNNYPNESLTVKEIANAVFVTPSYLSHLFKKDKGVSLSEYINKIRIDKAMLLLRQTEMDNGEIASRIGYVGRSYFCKMFKKFVGVSPQDYRKNVQRY